jgi:putative transposase
MDGSIELSAKERKVMLDTYRKSTSPSLRLRAHIVLLLADGYAWREIASTLFTSTRTIARWKARFEEQGIEGVLSDARGRPATLLVWWVAVMIHWVKEKTPRDFGFFRSRWSCGTIVLLLFEQHGIRVSTETIRRKFVQESIVWRRPRPVLGPKDPQYSLKLRRIRKLLSELPDGETVVFEDEVDINTNPKIGSMWMPRGKQAEVVTPGTNVKRYIAASLHWPTGKFLATEPGTQRNAALFVAHLHDLRRWLRCYRHIHVICDNAAFHKSRLVQEFVAEWGHRISIHFLPTYSPQTNPIERVWWHLHEEVTRNHRCRNIDELVDLTFDWFRYKGTFEIESSLYAQSVAA